MFLDNLRRQDGSPSSTPFTDEMIMLYIYYSMFTTDFFLFGIKSVFIECTDLI